MSEKSQPTRRALLFAAGATLAAQKAPEPVRSEPPKLELPKPDEAKPAPAKPQGARSVFSVEIPPGELIKAEAAPGDLAARRWKLQYEFDRPVEADKDVPIQVELGGIHFASSRYGAAWLTTFEQQRLGDPRVRFGKGYVLVTREGGAKWAAQRVKGYPRHFVAIDESRCWILTSDGIFFSPEFGAGWEKRKAPSDKLIRLHFLDENNGFAFGVGKIFWRTKDGGRSWTKVPESESLAIKSPNTMLAAMSFVTPKIGLVAGSSRPERMDMQSYLDRLPAWMTPERAIRRRELPGTLFTMETYDGGQTWKSSMTSGFGVLTQLKLAPRGGMAILAYGESIEWPTEVIRLDPRQGTNEPLFRRKRYEVTDCEVLSGGGYVLAAIEHSGRVRSAGIAGRLKIFWSNDGKQWIDMKVHYSAEGTQAFISRVSDTEMWAATDQGQILKLA